MDSLIYLTEKKSSILKARACANGSIQKNYISKEEAMSPTAATESVLITATIDARQKRDVMIADVPNAFVQTINNHMIQTEQEDQISENEFKENENINIDEYNNESSNNLQKIY